MSPISVSLFDPAQADIETALTSQLGDPALVLYFASSTHDHAAIASAAKRAFPAAVTVGCTTAGELGCGEMTKGSVVAMGIGGEVASHVEAAIVRDIAATPDGINAAFAAFERAVGRPMLDLDPEKWVGIILVDGLSGAEERVMDRIGDLTNVTFIGGSAGDDCAFVRTLVSLDGEAVSGAAVLLLLESPGGFDIIKTQSFHPTRRLLTPTKVDKATREVLEFNGRPAVQAYAEALGVDSADLANQFMAHPLGLMAGGEPFVRSPQQIVGDAVRFYCAVDEDVKLTVLDSTNIVDDTRKAIADAVERNGTVAGLINFTCILRTLELEAKSLTGEYGALFAKLPTAGFSTYGEEYIGHINQTATMLLFR